MADKGVNKLVKRFKSKIEAFKAAKDLQPDAERQKDEGLVLFVGSRPQVVDVAGDRDLAINAAVKILEENDTVVFISKIISRVGEAKITKDQLILTRTNNPKGGE